MYEVIWRGHTIQFELKRKNVRNINLNLKPDMAVMVSANARVPIEVIQDFVKSKASWIIKNAGYFDNAQQPKTYLVFLFLKYHYYLIL